METIRLEFQSNIKEKILELLSSFSLDELKIVHEDPDFDKNKKKLDIALAKIKNGTAKFYTLEEVDAMLCLKKQFLSMKIKLQEEFWFELYNLVNYISKDKPFAARKFKTDLLKNIKKYLKDPYHFKKSRYYDDENTRDYVFKGYVIVY